MIQYLLKTDLILLTVLKCLELTVLYDSVSREWKYWIKHYFLK